MSKDQDRVQELLELARKPIPKAKDLPSSYDDVQKFIILTEIKTDSSEIVPAYIIYELYIEWCEGNNIYPKSPILFFKRFCNLFVRIKKNGYMQYKVIIPKLDAYTKEQRKMMRSIYSKRNLSGKKTKKTIKKKEA